MPTIVQSILDRTETVPQRVLDLIDDVLRRSLHQHRHGLRIRQLFDESELVFALEICQQNSISFFTDKPTQKNV